MEKLSEVMALYNSEAIKRASNVIVDIGELTSINVMGLEILMLKDKMENQGPNNVVFCGLKPATRSIFETLDSEKLMGNWSTSILLREHLSFLIRHNNRFFCG